MSTTIPRAAERAMGRAQKRWWRLRLLRHTATLGAIASVGFLGFGMAVMLGGIHSAGTGKAVLLVMSVVTLVAWLVIALLSYLNPPDRRWLAGLVEHGQPRLLDRLNTMVFLERWRFLPRFRPFYERISEQAKTALGRRPAAIPFPRRQLLAPWLIFLVLLASTVRFYLLFAPYQRLLAMVPEPPPLTETTQLATPLVLSETNLVEKKEAWAEVRITEPGRDLQVTKVDVVPLHIEAAANEGLRAASYITTRNGAAEQEHALPAPTEPLYAVYQPVLYLDELGLADWDVLTYFARVNAASNAFASEVYFLEVRPFREDILKLPGGEGGQANRWLGELSALINRQQEVIRQTHQAQQRPQDQTNLREQDARKLAEAETDLGNTVEHVYAQMAAELENKPIGEALDHLAHAEKGLGLAAESCRTNALGPAQNHERSALADLVATRKSFQKAVSEHPQDFASAPEKAQPSDSAQAALKEIAEFRNEAKAAQEFVQKTLREQREITRQATTANKSNETRLAEQEETLRQSLADFEGAHPQPFQSVAGECAAAREGLSKAAGSFRSHSAQAKNQAQAAGEKLATLDQALGEKAAGRQLANAYRLKQMLEAESRQLGQLEEKTDSLSQAQVQELTDRAKETTRQLKVTAEQSPSREAFGPALREALTDSKKAHLDCLLDAVPKAEGEGLRKHTASWAKRGLDEVNQAFAQSEPPGLKGLQASPSPGRDAGASWDIGLAELESLIKQLEAGRSVPRGDQLKQGRQAVADLRDAAQGKPGSQEPVAKALVALEEEFKKNDSPLDLELLKKLRGELQRFALETADRAEKSGEKPAFTEVAGQGLPPAYRDRIQKYFRRLSEK